MDAQTLTLAPSLTEQPLKFQLAATIGLLVLDRTRLVDRIVTSCERQEAGEGG